MFSLPPSPRCRHEGSRRTCPCAPLHEQAACEAVEPELPAARVWDGGKEMGQRRDVARPARRRREHPAVPPVSLRRQSRVAASCRVVPIRRQGRAGGGDGVASALTVHHPEWRSGSTQIHAIGDCGPLLRISRRKFTRGRSATEKTQFIESIGSALLKNLGRLTRSKMMNVELTHHLTVVLTATAFSVAVVHAARGLLRRANLRRRHRRDEGSSRRAGEWNEGRGPAAGGAAGKPMGGPRLRERIAWQGGKAGRSDAGGRQGL